MSITQKKYKNLNLKISLKKLSFVIIDTLKQDIIALDEINYNKISDGVFIEEELIDVLNSKGLVIDEFDEVVVYYDNNLATIVPQSLFIKELSGSYLQYNVKVFETDFFDHDVVSNSELINVYVPYMNINNTLIDQFGSFEYKHCHTVLLEKLFEYSKNDEQTQMFVHVQDSNFEIVILKNQKLILLNSYDYTTKEDFLYYILFAAEQIGLNPEFFTLTLLGDISEESDLYIILYQYVRNVQFLNIAEYKYDSISNQTILKHFILLS